jgi:RNA polymerase sigma factor (sigma-70 family)
MDAIQVNLTTRVSMLLNDGDFDPSPGSAADPLEIIGVLAESVRRPYIQRARVWIGLLGIDEVQFSGEDAFQAALTDLCRRIRKGSIEPIRTLEQFRKSFAPRLRECLVDERRRQGARKRGGDLVVNLLSVVMDESFDLADAHIRPPNQHLEAQDQAKWLLSLLDREDESLRAILVLRVEGKTNADIATDLHMSVATVERIFAKIRSIWAPHIAENA